MVEIKLGQISEQDVDAIVDTRGIGEPGQARIAKEEHSPTHSPQWDCPTKARWVIHTVNPVWRGGAFSEPEMLAACYRESLRLAHLHGLLSIAFPALEDSDWSYPPELAARIAIVEVQKYELSIARPLKVRFVCGSLKELTIYESALREMSWP